MTNNATKTMMILGVITTMFLILPPAAAQNIQQVDGTSKHVPESITKHDLLMIDASQLMQKAEKSGSITLPLKGNDYEITLIENQLRDPNLQPSITVFGMEFPVVKEEVDTYKGWIDGKKHSSIVRLTFTDDWISGFVDNGTDRFYIESLKSYDQHANEDTHIIYSTGDTNFKIQLHDDAKKIPSTEITSYSTNEVSSTLALYSGQNELSVTPVDHKYSTTITADVILDCDKEYYQIDTSDWQSRQMVVLNDASANYESQVDVEFNVVDQHCDTTNSYLSSTDADTLLDQLQNHWDGDSTSRDFVHLTSGKDTSRNGDDLNVGLSFQDGIACPTTCGYGFTQQVDQPNGSYDATTYQKEVLTSHEIGHTFDAIHDDAVEISGDYTIMWPDFIGGSMLDIFSTGDQDPSKDNEETVRNSAEDHL